MIIEPNCLLHCANCFNPKKTRKDGEAGSLTFESFQLYPGLLLACPGGKVGTDFSVRMRSADCGVRPLDTMSPPPPVRS